MKIEEKNRNYSYEEKKNGKFLIYYRKNAKNGNKLNISGTFSPENGYIITSRSKKEMTIDAINEFNDTFNKENSFNSIFNFKEYLQNGGAEYILDFYDKIHCQKHTDKIKEFEEKGEEIPTFLYYNQRTIKEKLHYIKEKEEEYKEITAISESFFEDIATKLDDPDVMKKLDNYFSFMSSFHNYSLNNQYFLMMQVMVHNEFAKENGLEPLTPTLFASKSSFEAIKNKEGKYIEITAPVSKAFEVLRPIIKTIYELDENGKKKINPETKKPIVAVDKSGNKKQYPVGYTMEKVYDISQTNAVEIGAVEELKYRTFGNIDKDEVNKMMKKAEDAFGITIAYEQMDSDTGGYYRPSSHHIAINENNEPTHQLSSLFHEMGHSIMHNTDDYDAMHQDRGAKETQAEMVSYIIMKQFYDIGNASELYLGSWGAKGKELKEHLGVVNDAVISIVSRMGLDSSFSEINTKVNQAKIENSSKSFIKKVDKTAEKIEKAKETDILVKKD